MTESVALWLSERLLTASLQGAGVIALVWLICRSLPNIPASVHAALWWLAALKLVLMMLPVPALSIPVLPAALEWRRESPSPSPTVARRMDAAGSNTLAAPAALPASGSPVATPDSGDARWLQALMVFWFAVVVVQAVRLMMAFRTLRGVVRRSACWTDDEAGAVTRLAALVGLRRPPQVRTSDEIHAPQVTGLWRPVVLLPAETVTTFSAEERAMTLCHELMHIRRLDLVCGWVPALAERLFFFHPLAWLAAREYLTSRESACDAAVVHALGVSPTDYGRILVRLGVAGSEPALTAGGAPSSMSSLRRRLEMLQHAPSADASRRSTWLIAAIACAVIPLQLVAGTPPTQQPAAEARPSAETPRATVPVLPIETIPSSPQAPDAAPRQGELAAIQEAERVVEELVRRYQDVDALRQTSTELALRLEVEREAVEQQAGGDERRRMVEMLNSIAEQYARARVEQDSRESRERLLEQMARQQRADVSLNVQLEQLSRQVEIVTRQLKQVAEQQEQLAAAQRRLAEQAEQIRRLSEDTERIRKALEAR